LLPPSLRSFPTRRSSDLVRAVLDGLPEQVLGAGDARRDRLARLGRGLGAFGRLEVEVVDQGRGVERQLLAVGQLDDRGAHPRHQDRKSTRLNSSHVKISY